MSTSSHIQTQFSKHFWKQSHATLSNYFCFWSFSSQHIIIFYESVFLLTCFRAMQKNTQTKTNTVCNKFLYPTYHPATCLIQYSQFLQLTTYEYKPNVKPMVIWVLGTRDLGYFKCKSILSVITKCLFICLKADFENIQWLFLFVGNGMN
jgi:hypothetical protein